jgi:hypothetical protein
MRNRQHACLVDGCEFESVTDAARVLGLDPDIVHAQTKRGAPGYAYAAGKPARLAGQRAPSSRTIR